MSRVYRVEGIVLKGVNFGEADKIITVFTKQYGKLNFIAKGIRKITSRKGGNLDLFNLVTLSLAKGKNLDIATEVQTINTFLKFKKDIKKVDLAFQFCQLVYCLTAFNQENWQTFELLKNAFSSLVQEQINLSQLNFSFKVNILKITGFGLPAIINEASLNSHLENIMEKKVKCFYE